MLYPINLLLLYGGKSGEHEVSLVSAASILAHLDTEKYHIIPVGIDKEGRCFVNDYQEMLTYKKALPVSTSLSRPLESLLHHGRLAIDADVVFPVMHGPLYEDGALQGMLELAHVAYVGCGVLSSALGMDKDMSRRVAASFGVKTARYCHLMPLYYAQKEDLKTACHELLAGFRWPLFVKPNALGSSVGIHKVSNMETLLEAVCDAGRYDEMVLIEEAITGREIEVSVLEDISPIMRPKVSLPGEICVHHVDGFYSYAAKYLESEHTELIIPATLSEALIHRVQQLAVDIFQGLKCRGMARVDFFVDDVNNEIYFNEINTIPGFTPISMYPKMWQVSGLPYSALLDSLIRLALARFESRAQLVRHYQ